MKSFLTTKNNYKAISKYRVAPGKRRLILPFLPPASALLLSNLQYPSSQNAKDSIFLYAPSNKKITLASFWHGKWGEAVTGKQRVGDLDSLLLRGALCIYFLH